IIKAIWRAKAAIPRNSCTALLQGHKITIGAPAVLSSTIDRAPSVRIGQTWLRDRQAGQHKYSSNTHEGLHQHPVKHRKFVIYSVGIGVCADMSRELDWTGIVPRDHSCLS